MKIGQVLAILNESHILIEIDPGERCSTGDELVIYEEIKIDGIKELKEIRHPKGRVIIIASQSNRIFLASNIQSKSETRSLPIGGAFKSIFGNLETVIVDVPLKDKATFDKTQSLQLKFENIVKVGDLVTKSSYL